MDRLVWFVCFSVELCSSRQLGTGCCGTDGDGLCNECCLNYHMVQGTCQVCSPGFYGEKCLMKCTYPNYGELCLLNCSSCDAENCNPLYGCRIKEILTTSQPEQKNTSWLMSTMKNNRHDTTIYEGKLTKSKDYLSTRVVWRPLSTVRTTKQSTSIYTFHQTPKFPGSIYILTDNSWLISVVGLLGIFLGISVVVNFGLICLLCRKKKRPIDNTDPSVTRRIYKSSAAPDRNAQSFVRDHTSEDKSNTSRRISITDSTDHQSLSGVSQLRDSDEKGRSGVSPNATNTYMYMEPSTNQKITKKTSMDNSSYRISIIFSETQV